jgi:aminopeptidase N
MRAWRVVAAGAAAASALALAPPAGADESPTVGAATLGDPVFPNLGNGGYDVRSYDLDVTWDPIARRLRGVMTARAVATQALSGFSLDSAALDIATVQVDGVAAQFTTAGEKLLITPATPLRKGKSFHVVVVYQADPARIPQPVGGFVPTVDGFATAGQPAAAHAVFPCNDHPSDKAVFTFHVTTPAGLVGVANGLQTASVHNPDGSTTATFSQAAPMATELAQIAVGQFSVLDHGDYHGVHLRDVAPFLEAPLLSPALNLTPDQLGWITGQLGQFPFKSYGLLPVNGSAAEPFAFKGLETQTLTLYRADYLLNPEDKIGGHMVHELTHSWFGDSVTPHTWADLWLNEGHAEYYALNYRYSRGWPDTWGSTTFDDRMRKVYAKANQWRTDSGPVAQPTAPTLFDNERYTGGTLVLYALALRVGPAAFADIEHTFLARYRYGNASTADYIRTAAEVSGDAGVESFLKAWLYGTTVPPIPQRPQWTVDPVAPPPSTPAGLARLRAALRTDAQE